jgi:hypothetical protein
MTPPSHRRDERVDLIKGAALMLVFCDHLEDALGVGVLSRWTLRALGPSDAAEQFVLLSGLVVGRATAGRLDREGWATTQLHALGRAVQVYLGLVIGAAASVLLSAAAGVAPAALFPAGETGDFSGTVASDVAALLFGVVTLQRLPAAFHILMLYLVLLPAAPGIVWLARRSRAAAVVLPLLLYAAVQAGIWGVGSAADWRGGLRIYFHPLAWQFLFVIGLWGGMRWRDQGEHPAPVEDRWEADRIVFPGWLVAVCGGIVVLGWWLRPSVTGGVEPLAIGGVELPRNPTMQLLFKPTLGPLRLLHALAAAVLVWRMIPRQWARQAPALVQPWVWCGRYSLQSYLLGAVLTSGSVLAGDWFGREAGAVLLIELQGWLLVMGTAWGRDRLRQRSGRRNRGHVPEGGAGNRDQASSIRN